MGSSSQPGSARAAPVAPPVPDLLGDLLDLETPVPHPPSGDAASAGGVVDLLGGLDLGSERVGSSALVAPAAAAVQPSSISQLAVLVGADKGKGLVIRGGVSRRNASPCYLLEFQNTELHGTALDGFMIQFNKNVFGLQPANQVVAVTPVAPGTIASAIVPLVHSPAMVSAPGASPSTLQVAFKCNQRGVLYSTDVVPLSAVLAEDGRVESAAFVTAWKDITDSEEVQQTISSTINDVAAATQSLGASNLFVMAQKSVGGEDVLYVTGRAILGADAAQLLLELRFVKEKPGIRAFFRCTRADLAPAVFEAIAKALAS